MTFATAAFPKNFAEIVYMSHEIPVEGDPLDDWIFRDWIQTALECGAWGFFREQI